MRFKDNKGLDTDFLGCTICPIVEIIADNMAQLSGTGFYINPQGLALSASHNFRKRTANTFSRGKIIDQIETATFIRMISLGRNRIHLLFTSIEQVIFWEGVDIAIVFSGVSDNPPKLLGLTCDVPEIGEKIYAYSYPNKTGHTSNIASTISLDNAEFEGIVTDHYPLGRDRILLPGPCVEARMAAPGGTSGGPVFNDSGYIFGVISTSFDGDPPIAYITPLAPIFDLNFDTKTDKGTQRLSLRKLSMLGLIAVFEKYKGGFRHLL